MIRTTLLVKQEGVRELNTGAESETWGKAMEWTARTIQRVIDRQGYNPTRIYVDHENVPDGEKG